MLAGTDGHGQEPEEQEPQEDLERQAEQVGGPIASIADGVRGVRAGLRAAGVQEKRLTIVRVPGANELPSALQLLAPRARFDVFVALGVLIRGETIHYELIAESASHALQRVALDTRTPVINGVIAVETTAQAAARCGGRIDRGAEFARAALEMADLKRRLKTPQ